MRPTRCASSGLEEPAREALAAGVPFFGVCIGFQLLYEGSVESPAAKGLGVFPGTVAPLPPGVKHPQMQWNRLTVSAGGTADDDAADRRPTAGPPRGLGERPWVYFVHSFAPPVGPETVAVCDYGGPGGGAGRPRHPVGRPVPPREVGCDRPRAPGQLRRLGAA